MLLGECRTATVVALDNCELYSLSRSGLDTLLEQWPEMAKEFEDMMKVGGAEGSGTACLHHAAWQLTLTFYGTPWHIC